MKEGGGTLSIFENFHGKMLHIANSQEDQRKNVEKNILWLHQGLTNALTFLTEEHS